MIEPPAEEAPTRSQIRLFADPWRSGVVWAQMPYRLFRTVDGMQTWTPVFDLPEMRTFAASPSDPLRMYAGGGQGIYTSRDGGDSWVLVNPAGVASLAVDPGDPERLLLGSDRAGYLSSDGGATWTEIGPPSSSRARFLPAGSPR